MTATGTLKYTSKDTLRDALTRLEKEGAALGLTRLEALRDAVMQVAQ